MFGGEKKEIEFICPVFLLDTVIELFGKEVFIGKINEDTIKVKLSVNPMGFRMWAMRNIDCVDVIKPIELRNEIKEIIEEASKRYNK